MADWDRKYNNPTTLNQPYTVTISCPANWRPKGQARPSLKATRIGTVPNESYQIIYEKLGASAKVDDVWKIGDLTYQGGNARYPTVSVEHTATPPPTNPISQDRPTIRDGSGGGAGEGSGSGTFTFEIPGRYLKGKVRIGLLHFDIQDLTKLTGDEDPGKKKKNSSGAKGGRKKPLK